MNLDDYTKSLLNLFLLSLCALGNAASDVVKLLCCKIIVPSSLQDIISAEKNIGEEEYSVRAAQMWEEYVSSHGIGIPEKDIDVLKDYVDIQGDPLLYTHSSDIAIIAFQKAMRVCPENAFCIVPLDDVGRDDLIPDAWSDIILYTDYNPAVLDGWEGRNFGFLSNPVTEKRPYGQKLLYKSGSRNYLLLSRDTEECEIRTESGFRCRIQCSQMPCHDAGFYDDLASALSGLSGNTPGELSQSMEILKGGHSFSKHPKDIAGKEYLYYDMSHEEIMTDRLRSDSSGRSLRYYSAKNKDMIFPSEMFLKGMFYVLDENALAAFVDASRTPFRYSEWFDDDGVHLLQVRPGDLTANSGYMSELNRIAKQTRKILRDKGHALSFNHTAFIFSCIHPDDLGALERRLSDLMGRFRMDCDVRDMVKTFAGWRADKYLDDDFSLSDAILHSGRGKRRRDGDINRAAFLRVFLPKASDWGITKKKGSETNMNWYLFMEIFSCPDINVESWMKSCSHARRDS